MTSLIIPATRNTPLIHFEPATWHFEISGICVPENAGEFFEPVFGWLALNAGYLAPGSTFHFHLTYFNSTSLKALYHVLRYIKEANVMGAGLNVRWYVERDDEFMLESVALFGQLLDLQMETVELPGDQSASLAG